MTITLTAEQEELILGQIAGGRYGSPDEVVTEALRRLELQCDPLGSEEVRQEIEVGLEQERQGDYAPLDIEEILSKGRGVLAQRQRAS